MEIIVMPYATNMMLGEVSEIRRIYTDGRKWPEELEPAHSGYSIGAWEDTDRDGRYDTLVVETRGMKGPARSTAADCLCTTIMRRSSKSVLASIKPIRSSARRDHDHRPRAHSTLDRDSELTSASEIRIGSEFVCSEHNRYVTIGTETYSTSDDDFLMPSRKGQPAPDLRYFPNRK